VFKCTPALEYESKLTFNETTITLRDIERFNNESHKYINDFKLDKATTNMSTETVRVEFTHVANQLSAVQYQ